MLGGNLGQFAEQGEPVTVDEFIERWRDNEGGAERANYALFLTELCSLLGLPSPAPAGVNHERNDYVFERAVVFDSGQGKASHGRIDLYKRGCFVLEAKQSGERGGAKEVALSPEQAALPGLNRMPMSRDDAGRKMGAVAPTLFGAIKLLVNNRTAISEVRRQPDSTCIVKTSRALIFERRGNHP